MNKSLLRNLIKRVDALNPNGLIEWGVLLNGKQVKVKMKMEELKKLTTIYIEAML